MLQERTLDAGSVTINFAEGPPNGPPLVLLHGGSGRWQFWDPVVKPLEARSHLYTPDLRGHGGSSWTPGNYRLVDYASDIEAFLDHVVREPAALIGHSLGGEIALIVAARTPEQVRAVIVEDAPLSADAARRAIDRTGTNVRSMRELAGSTLSVGELRSRVAQLPLDGTGRGIVLGDVADEADLMMYAESMRRNDPSMLDAVLEFEDMHAGYGDPVLARVRCPVLILHGDPAAGAVLRDTDVDHAMTILPNARSVRFVGMGHSLHMEDPRAVLGAVTSFLDTTGL